MKVKAWLDGHPIDAVIIDRKTYSRADPSYAFSRFATQADLAAAAMRRFGATYHDAWSGADLGRQGPPRE